MAALYYGQETHDNSLCSPLASGGSTMHEVVLSKPVQPVENTSALKVSLVIRNNGIVYKESSEDSIMSHLTQEELSNLNQIFQNIYIRMSSSSEPITSVNPVREALDAEGQKLPVKLLRKYVRCLYHEVTKLSETRAKTSRICTWSCRPADWPEHIPFQDPNNSSIRTKRSSKKDLQAMFDYLISKYKKLIASNEHSFEESSDELDFDSDLLGDLSVIAEEELLDLNDIQCEELSSTLQQQLLSTSYSTPKPGISIEKSCSVPNGKFIPYSNTPGINQVKIDTKSGVRKIVATAGNAIEACDEVQPKT